MNNQNTLTLVDPENGNLAFKILAFENNDFFDHIQRNNYYSLIWIKQGKAKLNADFSEYNVSDNYLLAFSPYQPFMLKPKMGLSGMAIQFHPDFFCILRHHSEVSCNGILFNNIYSPPFVVVSEKVIPDFEMLIKQMKSEMQNNALAQHELLVSYLKIFLINASRLKAEQQAEVQNGITNLKEPFILQSLKDAIETNFKTKHSAGDYAAILNVTTKTLGKIAKSHLNKTLTGLISERIVIEAKRELYLTDKPIKQIAYELGYDDEYYFSRFFKTNTDVSPQLYRSTVGYNRQSLLLEN